VTLPSDSVDGLATGPRGIPAPAPAREAPAGNARTTVLLVDDQQLVRSGFSLILSVEDDLDVIGEAADGAEAVRLVRELRPDVVLMDVQMPVMDGIEATRRIVGAGLSKVLILTTFDRDDYVFAGLAAGASGFLLKNADAEHLIEAVRAVAGGHALLAPEVTLRVIAQMTADDRAGMPSGGLPDGADSGAGSGAGSSAVHPRLAELTPRELEVLRLVGRGLSNAEIARHLFLGEATVKTHLSSVLRKLGLRDRVQAVVLAYEAGLILPGDGPAPPAG
jgi:DNA-binding NarL/FixJ family response regulator